MEVRSIVNLFCFAISIHTGIENDVVHRQATQSAFGDFYFHMELWKKDYVKVEHLEREESMLVRWLPVHLMEDEKVLS